MHGDTSRRGSFDPRLSRRQALRAGFGTLGLLMTGPTLFGCGSSGARTRSGLSRIGELGPLGEPDANGIRLPQGFTSRALAFSREPVFPGETFRWHLAPDGGATYAAPDGGWVYVSNSEIPGVGGVGALRFDAQGNLVDAYPILRQTNINCAGGPTPWGTWLSCEEAINGRVWECDPFGGQLGDEQLGIVRPALGTFMHEAVAVDPELGQLYLTEDVSDGCLYRYTPHLLTPDGHPDLTAGTLEVAQVLGGGLTGAVEWHPLSNPNPNINDPAHVPTRYQVPESSVFRGGEGIWYHERVIYFATKGDDRVWAYDVESAQVEIIYDRSEHDEPPLRGVDNVLVSSGGDVLVAEDGGSMQIVALTPSGDIVPVLQVVGQDDSEICGPAFSPDGERLYFSSQRGYVPRPLHGITYEVRGPFFT